MIILPIAFALTMARPGGAPVVTVADTTWYVTNRARAGGSSGGARADSLEFGYVVTRYRETAGRDAADPWTHQLDGTQEQPVQVSRDEFRVRVAGATMPGEGPVVYVHGFATSFARAIAQGSDIKHRGRYRGPFVVFSWPAHAAFAVLPRPGAIISRAYRDDSIMAAASTGAFRSALDAIRESARDDQLTVVAHSLGAQLVAEALAVPSTQRTALIVQPLKSLVLFAPDIDAERYRDVLDQALAPVAARRIVYASGADKMLALSRLVNHSPRAGQGRSEAMFASSVTEVVDVTDGRRTDGRFRKLVEPRHSMRYAASALRDFFGVVRGATSDCRETDGFARRTGDHSWRLASVPPPPGEITCVTCEPAGPPPPRR